MDTPATHLTIVLDRTGSMQSIRDDVIGGYNSFLAGQQALPGRATLTLVQFDSQDPYEVVHDAVPLAQARPLTPETFVPRASTPLYDALGRALLATEAWVAAQPEASRPGQVVVAVVTDGEENASVEFTGAQVRKLLAERQSAGWKVIFLSADLAAFEDAGLLGVPMESRMAFSADAGGVEQAFDAKSRMVKELREGKFAGFSEAERKAGKR